MKLRTLAVLLLAALAAFADIESVKAEPDLEKRSEKALRNADAAVDNARKAYHDGGAAAMVPHLTEVEQSITLCRESLDNSGKRPRKSPKYFKRAEIGLRQLMRRLDTLKSEVSIDDAAPVEKLHTYASETRDYILNRIMSKK